MKVIVRPASNRVTKTDMERAIEELFQENKDLRVEAGHAQDEIHCLMRQNDKLRAEIAELREGESTGMNALVKFWDEAIRERNEARERAEEYRIALMESDCRVDELEKRNEWLVNENQTLIDQYEETIRNLRTEAMAAKDVAHEQMKRADNLASRLALVEKQNEELERMKHANNCLCDQIDRQADELASLRHEKYEQTERIKALESQTWDLQNKLVAANNEIDTLIDERDTASDRADTYENLYHEADKSCGVYRASAEAWHEKHDKMERIANDYGLEVDRLRKVVTDLQTHRFTAEEFVNMCMTYIHNNNTPSTDK